MKLPKLQLKKKKKFKKRGFLVPPHAAWAGIVCITAILMILSFTYGFYLFMKTDQAFQAPSLGEPREKILDKERIENALRYFSQKEERSENIISNPARVVDPSR